MVVNPKNDFVKALSVEQLKAIWEPGSKVKTWKDVDPSWPDRPIVLYSPDNDSGTFEFFTEAIVGKAKSQRDDVQQTPTTTRWSRAWPATRTGSATSATPTTRRTRTSSGPSPIQNGKDAKAVLPEPGDDHGQVLCPPVPAALHLREELGGAAAGGRPVRQVLPREHRRLAEEGGYDAPTAEDKAANQEALDQLLGGDAKAARRGEEIEAGALSSLLDHNRHSDGRPGRSPDLWTGHSRLLVVWEAAVTVGLVLCAVITVLTTVGIILVLGVQSFEFFSHAHVGRVRVPLRDASSSPTPTRRGSASCR